MAESSTSTTSRSESVIDRTSDPVPGPSSIPLYLINGVATVWDAQTAATLHCQQNMSGLRVGTLPGVSQQNGFLGLPITLMQEETAYLVQQGIAHLIPVNPHPRPPSEDIIAANTAERISRIKRLDRLAREHAERQAQLGEKAFEKGGEKARAKREARARARAKAEKAQAKAGGAAGGEDVGERKGGGAGAGAGQEDSVEDPGATPQGRMAGMEDVDRSSEPPFSEDGQSVATPERETTLDTGSNGQPTQDLASTTTSTSAPTTPLISKSDTSKPTPSPTFISSHFHAIPSHPLPRTNPFLPSITALPHPLFPFPTTPRHLALLSVFTTLQTRGYRVGLGPRFGGEYLIYPGDYLRYHAHFTSQVIVRDECIKPTEIVAWGRLGTGTKKAGLLCCWDDGERGEGGPQQVSTSEGEKRDMPDGAGPGEKKGEVEFYSLEWANFG